MPPSPFSQGDAASFKVRKSKNSRLVARGRQPVLEGDAGAEGRGAGRAGAEAAGAGGMYSSTALAALRAEQNFASPLPAAPAVASGAGDGGGDAVMAECPPAEGAPAEGEGGGQAMAAMAARARAARLEQRASLDEGYISLSGGGAGGGGRPRGGPPPPPPFASPIVMPVDAGGGDDATAAWEGAQARRGAVRGTAGGGGARTTPSGIPLEPVPGVEALVTALRGAAARSDAEAEEAGRGAERHRTEAEAAESTRGAVQAALDAASAAYGYFLVRSCTHSARGRARCARVLRPRRVWWRRSCTGT